MNLTLEIFHIFFILLTFVHSFKQNVRVFLMFSKLWNYEQYLLIVYKNLVTLSLVLKDIDIKNNVVSLSVLVNSKTLLKQKSEFAILKFLVEAFSYLWGAKEKDGPLYWGGGQLGVRNYIKGRCVFLHYR